MFLTIKKSKPHTYTTLDNNGTLTILFVGPNPFHEYFSTTALDIEVSIRYWKSSFMTRYHK